MQDKRPPAQPSHTAYGGSGYELQAHPVDVFLRIFGPENGIDLDLPPRSADPQRPLPEFADPDQA